MCIRYRNNYSLLNRNMEREMLPLVQETGLGVMTYSPLCIGLLTGMYTVGEPPPKGTLWDERREEFEGLLTGNVAETLNTAQSVAAQRGVTLPQLAVNWVLSRRERHVAITGSDTIEHLDDHLGAFEGGRPHIDAAETHLGHSWDGHLFVDGQGPDTARDLHEMPPSFPSRPGM